MCARHHTRWCCQVVSVGTHWSECDPRTLSRLSSAFWPRGPKWGSKHLPDTHWPGAPPPSGERSQQLRPLPGVPVFEFSAASSGSGPGRSTSPRGHTSRRLVPAAHHTWLSISTHTTWWQRVHGILRDCRGYWQRSTRGRAADGYYGERDWGIWIHYCRQSHWSAS